MIDTLKAWLNGTRNYTVGVEIFAVLSNDQRLIAVFRQGETLNSKYRLYEGLKELYYSLKKKKDATTKVRKPATSTQEGNTQPESPQHPAGPITGENSTPAIQDTTNTAIDNTVYEACKLEADNLYKEAMNKRAVLFSMVPAELYDDPNRPDLVLQRSALCIEVVTLYNRASKLYDKANYVKEHGRLPGTDKETEQETDYATLPNHKVKQSLDNLRKNYNKIKQRDQTPERIALMQKHEANIKYLEERWLLLK